MKSNRNALAAIACWKNVELAILCLSSELQVGEGKTETYFSLEPKTMALAGKIGIKLAFDVQISIEEDYYYRPFAEE